MNITADDFELRHAWSDMLCQFVGISEDAQGQKVTIADLFKKDWVVRKNCQKDGLKTLSKSLYDAAEQLKKSSNSGDLIETETKKARAKAMQARKPSLGNMSTKLVVTEP